MSKFGKRKMSKLANEKCLNRQPKNN
jgi:hypothetical protein